MSSVMAHCAAQMEENSEGAGCYTEISFHKYMEVGARDTK